MVKKGEKYYTWQLHGRSPQISKTYPKRQQLTSSDFLIQVYDLEDELSDISSDVSDKDGLEAFVEEFVQKIRDLASEQEDKRNNMPEGLQDSSVGELLQNRADSLEEWASNIESVDLDDYEELERSDDERDVEESEEDFEEYKENHFQDWLDEKCVEISGFTYEGE